MNTINVRIYLFIAVSILVCQFFNSPLAAGDRDKSHQQHFQKAVVTEIVKENIIQPHGVHTRAKGFKLVNLELLSGEEKGNIYLAKAKLSVIPGVGVDATVGLKVLVRMIEFKDDTRVVVVGYYRENYLYLIIGIFLALLIIIGGRKGVKSAVSLGCTLFMIFYVMIPLLSRSYDPVLTAVVTAVVINIVVFTILAGFTRKAFTAIVGTTCGVASAGLIASIIGKLSHTIGIPMEEAQGLYFKQMGSPLDFQGLIFAGVLIGSLGAVMDVSMSIATSIEEILIHNPLITRSKLFYSGMKIGRDIMGTMSNTLILAYVGGSLSLILLLDKLEKPYLTIINSDLIAGGIIQATAGAIGIVLAVPITAFAGIIRLHQNEPVASGKFR